MQTIPPSEFSPAVADCPAADAALQALPSCAAASAAALADRSLAQGCMCLSAAARRDLQRCPASIFAQRERGAQAHQQQRCDQVAGDVQGRLPFIVEPFTSAPLPPLPALPPFAAAAATFGLKAATCSG